MEVTRKEIIASITIIAVMILIGVMISGKISEAYMDSQEKYNKATKIESSELFRYGMDTNIGNAFVYGNFKALDPVTFPEIGGQYLSIEKVKERYTMHTRTVTKTVNGKTTTSTETYWTWDKVGSEELKTKRVKFCDIEFEYSQFNQLSNDYIDTIKESSHVRYKYYAHPAESKGTIFAYLINRNLGEDGATYFEGKTIDETVDGLDNNFGMYVFWLMWIVLTGAVTYGFYYLENRWLES
jgi:hypothetical protein